MYSVFRCLLLLVVVCLLNDVSSSDQVEFPSEEALMEFSRTNSCVAGRLPMEVRFDVPDNPKKLQSEVLEIEEIASLASKVDIRIRGLLRNAMLAAWENIGQCGFDDHQFWTTEFTQTLLAELSGEIIERAPRTLGMEFCGIPSSVGGAAHSFILGYFARAVRQEGGQYPEWSYHMDDTPMPTGVVLLATALWLASIEFDVRELLLSRWTSPPDPDHYRDCVDRSPAG